MASPKALNPNLIGFVGKIKKHDYCKSATSWTIFKVEHFRVLYMLEKVNVIHVPGCCTRRHVQSSTQT